MSNREVLPSFYSLTGLDGSFVNRVSDTHQEEPPDDFHGGIIADPMGFGKTLTMIALIASDISGQNAAGFSNSGGAFSQSLVIVPPPCEYLRAWRAEGIGN